MDRDLTINETLILGLIASSKLINSRFNPDLPSYLTSRLSGKNLESVIEKANMRFWTPIGKSSIYSILKRLAKVNYIKSQTETIGTPPIRTLYYNCTQKGIKQLTQEIEHLLSTVTPIIDIFSISFGFSHLLTQSHLKDCLKTRLEKMKKFSQEVEDKFNNFHFGNDHEIRIFKNLLQRGQFHMKAELEWLEDVTNDLEKVNESKI